MHQWMLKITEYADRLIEYLDELYWLESLWECNVIGLDGQKLLSTEFYEQGGACNFLWILGKTKYFELS